MKYPYAWAVFWMVTIMHLIAIVICLATGKGEAAELVALGGFGFGAVLLPTRRLR